MGARAKIAAFSIALAATTLMPAPPLPKPGPEPIIGALHARPRERGRCTVPRDSSAWKYEQSKKASSPGYSLCRDLKEQARALRKALDGRSGRAGSEREKKAIRGALFALSRALKDGRLHALTESVISARKLEAGLAGKDNIRNKAASLSSRLGQLAGEATERDKQEIARLQGSLERCSADNRLFLLPLVIREADEFVSDFKPKSAPSLSQNATDTESQRVRSWLSLLCIAGIALLMWGAKYAWSACWEWKRRNDMMEKHEKARKFEKAYYAKKAELLGAIKAAGNPEEALEVWKDIQAFEDAVWKSYPEFYRKHGGEFIRLEDTCIFCLKTHGIGQNTRYHRLVRALVREPKREPTPPRKREAMEKYYKDNYVKLRDSFTRLRHPEEEGVDKERLYEEYHKLIFDAYDFWHEIRSGCPELFREKKKELGSLMQYVCGACGDWGPETGKILLKTELEVLRKRGVDVD